MIRTAVAALAVTIGALFALPGAADAVPGAESLIKIDGSQAKKVAVGGQDFFVQLLPGPRTYRVGTCTGGPKVWHCPSVATGGDVRCTASIWVWRTKLDFYMEWHKMRCR